MSLSSVQRLRNHVWLACRRIRFAGLFKAITIVGIQLLLAVTFLEFKPEPLSYKSAATIAACPTSLEATFMLNRWGTDISNGFIEALEGDMLKERAKNQIKVHFPNLTPCKIRVSVTQIRQSYTFEVVSSGEAADYTHVFLKTLLDELLIYRKEMHDAHLKRVFDSGIETMLKKRREIWEKVQRLEDLRKEDVEKSKEQETQDIRNMMADQKRLQSEQQNAQRAYDSLYDRLKVLQKTDMSDPIFVYIQTSASSAHRDQFFTKLPIWKLWTAGLSSDFHTEQATASK